MRLLRLALVLFVLALAVLGAGCGKSGGISETECLAEPTRCQHVGDEEQEKADELNNAKAKEQEEEQQHEAVRESERLASE